MGQAEQCVDRLGQIGVCQDSQGASDIDTAYQIQNIVCTALGYVGLKWVNKTICKTADALDDVDLGEVQSKVDDFVNNEMPSWFKRIWEWAIQLGE